MAAFVYLEYECHVQRLPHSHSGAIAVPQMFLEAAEPALGLVSQAILFIEQRICSLHHAAQGPLVGFWMIEELRRHGYELSPGTIYPLLHGLQKKGYLSVEVKREGRRAWREYSATKEGKRVLNAAKRKLRELFHELIE